MEWAVNVLHEFVPEDGIRLLDWLSAWIIQNCIVPLNGWIIMLVISVIIDKI